MNVAKKWQVKNKNFINITKFTILKLISNIFASYVNNLKILSTIFTRIGMNFGKILIKQNLDIRKVMKQKEESPLKLKMKRLKIKFLKKIIRKFKKYSLKIKLMKKTKINSKITLIEIMYLDNGTIEK